MKRREFKRAVAWTEAFTAASPPEHFCFGLGSAIRSLSAVSKVEHLWIATPLLKVQTNSGSATTTIISTCIPGWAKAAPQFQQFYNVTDDADFILACVALEALTQRVFFQNSNVRRFWTSVVMEPTKVGLTLPI